MSAAAKWHRERIADHHGCPDIECAEKAAHHAAAAAALEALAVPGVAGLLARLSRGETDDFRTGDDERASLATLARIGKEADRG